MATFDAPDRETCVVRRACTNTPLQALVLLNDPTYIEAARKLAERIILAAEEPAVRISLAFRIVLSRRPSDSEQTTLEEIAADASKHFVADPHSAEQFLSIGASVRDPSLSPIEVAAWTTAMSVLLNLDESISKR